MLDHGVNQPLAGRHIAGSTRMYSTVQTTVIIMVGEILEGLVETALSNRQSMVANIIVA